MMIHSASNRTNLLLSRFSLLVLTIGLSFIGFSQDEEQPCGTTIDATNLNRLVQLNEEWINRAATSDEEIKAYGGSTYFVPVVFHIIRQDSGLGGLSEAEALAALERMNEYYIDASIHFYQCGPIDLIDNSTYYDYNKAQMVALDAAYSQANVVNIYSANSAENSSGSSICGHAEFPGGLDFILLANSCTNNGSTLAHEMGHYLGLYHTHSSSFGDEAVDGSDCATEGDLLCDTPADPQLSTGNNYENDGCYYYGTATDENGDMYVPDPHNFMSYASKECRYTITEDQMEKALWTLINERDYLTCTPPSLEANFYVRQEESCAQSKGFSFYNVSEGDVSSYSWDFGDGIGTSTDESPDYIYNATGIFTVTLTVSDGGSTETYSQNVVVGAVTPPYTNDFETGAAALDDFVTYSMMKNEVVVDPDAAESGSYGLSFDGTDEDSNSPTFQTPNSTEAFQEAWNPYYKANAELCVDASWYTNVQLEFDKLQLRTSNDDYTQFVITINGVQEGAVLQVNSPGDDDLVFTHLTYDLSAYSGQIFTIGFHGTHKYDKDKNGTNNGNATFIDNINITGLLSTVEIDDLEPLVIYPNPAKDLISFQMGDQNLTDFWITDVLGKRVNEFTPIEATNGSTVSFNVSKLSPGTYYVRTGSGIGKFVKK